MTTVAAEASRLLATTATTKTATAANENNNWDTFDYLWHKSTFFFVTGILETIGNILNLSTQMPCLFCVKRQF